MDFPNKFLLSLNVLCYSSDSLKTMLGMSQEHGQYVCSRSSNWLVETTHHLNSLYFQFRSCYGQEADLACSELDRLPHYRLESQS